TWPSWPSRRAPATTDRLRNERGRRVAGPFNSLPFKGPIVNETKNADEGAERQEAQKKPKPERLLLSYVEGAEMLGCPTKTVKNMVKRGGIKAKRLGRLVKFPRQEVERFIEYELKNVKVSPAPSLASLGRGTTG